MKTPRFTSRQMLGFFTILALLIVTLVGIESWRRNANHAAYVHAYRLNRQVIESGRAGLSPEYYVSASRELDAEGTRLGIAK